MPNWTTAADVTDAWIGEGAPTDTTKIEKWLEKAEREIRNKVPGIQARIDAEANETPARTDLRELAVDVAVAMVTRVFENPRKIRQENEVTGPFTTSRTFSGDKPGELVITDEELAKLHGKQKGAFTIDLIPSTSPFYVGPS